MYSLLDGYATPEEYLKRAKEIGLNGFCITEHGNAYSWCYFDKLKKDYPCAHSSLIYGALLGIILIISLFYTYSGILGKNYAFADISIFYISVIWAFFVSYKKASLCKTKKYAKLLNILAIAVTILFFIFTVSPPDIPLFIAP